MKLGLTLPVCFVFGWLRVDARIAPTQWFALSGRKGVCVGNLDFFPMSLYGYHRHGLFLIYHLFEARLLG